MKNKIIKIQKNEIVNIKQKYYEELVKTIDPTAINILHVSNISITGYYSHFIRLGALLKKRNNTALSYKYGCDPRIYEAFSNHWRF